MKKTIAMILSLVLISSALTACGNTAANSSVPAASSTPSSSAAASEQNAAAYTESSTNLGVGSVQVYDFGTIKLHAYKTNDALADECLLFEGADELVALEAPGFKDNNTEYAEYIASLGKPLNNILLAYHPAGAETMSDSAAYIGTETSQKAQQEGGSIKGLIDQFVGSYGDDYDGTIPAVTEIVEPGTITLGGIEFVISDGTDGFDVVIPEINSVFTHMVGSDVHNILPSVDAIDALAALMQSYIDADYTLILSSHYAPENIEAAKTKLAYAEKLKELAVANTTADDFLAAANAEFSNYTGVNYLEMSAAGLYQ